MSIGLRIKFARKEKKMTQQELSQKANISRSYLGDIEGDRYNPSVDTLKSLASVLQVDVSSFLSDAKKNAPSPERADAIIDEVRIMLEMASPEKRIAAVKALRILLEKDTRESHK